MAKSNRISKEEYNSRHKKIITKEPIVRLYAWSELNDLKNLIDKYFDIEGVKKIKSTPDTYFDSLAKEINDFSLKNDSDGIVSSSYLAKLYFYEKEEAFKKFRNSSNSPLGINKNSRIIDKIRGFLIQFITNNTRPQAISSNSIIDVETATKIKEAEQKIYWDRFTDAHLILDDIPLVNNYLKARIEFLRQLIHFKKAGEIEPAISALEHCLTVYSSYDLKEEVEETRMYLSAFRINDSNYKQTDLFFKETINTLLQEKKIRHLGLEYLLYTEFLLYHGNFIKAEKVFPVIHKIVGKYQDTIQFSYSFIISASLLLLEGSFELFFRVNSKLLNMLAKRHLSTLTASNDITLALNSYKLAYFEYESGNFAYDLDKRNDLTVAINSFKDLGMQFHLLKAHILRTQFLFQISSKDEAKKYYQNIYDNEIDKNTIKELDKEWRKNMDEQWRELKVKLTDDMMDEEEHTKKMDAEKMLRKIPHFKIDFYYSLMEIAQFVSNSSLRAFTRNK